MPDEPYTSEEFRSIATTAGELSKLVRVNTDQVRRLTARITKNETTQRLTVIGLIAVALLMLGVGVLFFNLRSATERLNAQQRQAEVTRSQVLCPLYNLLVGAYSAAGRDRYQQGPAAYDAAHAVIRESYAVLECNPQQR